nr:hypothetical protein [Tanacetum cinerariifolium]
MTCSRCSQHRPCNDEEAESLSCCSSFTGVEKGAAGASIGQLGRKRSISGE